jgi:hypothetical protein
MDLPKVLGMDKQHEHQAVIFSVDMKHGCAARTRIDMQQGYEWKCSLDI